MAPIYDNMNARKLNSCSMVKTINQHQIQSVQPELHFRLVKVTESTTAFFKLNQVLLISMGYTYARDRYFVAFRILLSVRQVE